MRWTERLAEAGDESSEDSLGDYYDNGTTAGHLRHRSYKTDLIRHRGPWWYLKVVENAALEWLDRFNQGRPLEWIGHR